MAIATGRVFALVALTLISGFIIFWMQKARNGHVPFIRQIPGMVAIEEAVGRATEMGRAIHFCPGTAGLTDAESAQTFAALEVLSYVSRLVARYGAKIIVTLRRPEVLPVAEEMVRQGYLLEGKPEMYDPTCCRFLSSEQFAYAAGAMGIMEREKVAVNIALGAFWAESLLLAETGRNLGAIQITGTARVAQIQMFVATSDYTLIGEELFAAGAVASQNPIKLGSIAGQDMGKLLALLLLAIGVATQTFGSNWFTTLITK